MTSHEVSEAPTTDEATTAARETWAAGDYHRFAKALFWDVGPVLVEACGIARGQRILDVAAGSGNVALRAAERGAEVVASDLTPENLEAGRREARALGLDLEWVEADAQQLPFADAAFDVVTSCAGAMFAPDHRAVAGELLRVCRPGGTIGMVNFTPEGLAGELFGLFARYAPPPPEGAQSPLLWGREEHVRELLGAGVDTLELTRREYVEQAFGGPADYCAFYKETFGPVVSIHAALAGDAERTARLDREFLDLAMRSNRGAPGHPAEYRYEYLLVVARRRGAPARRPVT